jgi:hypothetical protein
MVTQSQRNALAMLLLEKIIIEVESWDSQEDGIPDSMWETYLRSKQLLIENQEPV